MNITDLARKLKIPTSELLEKLPQLGFDIGKKAIKINDMTAHKILTNWPQYQRKLKYAQEQASINETNQSTLPAEKKVVKIPKFITVKDFAALADIGVSKVLGELMKNGIFVSMNEKIDSDAAMIIGEDLNIEVVVSENEADAENNDRNRVQEAIATESGDSLTERPPVIVVMGHVDHGKTKLLDTIRKTDVVAGEAGGITQHIGAYQIERNGKKITFIDTPGHEVFTAMRSRGAKVADIAILVVAADDGVKPQTLEACRIIEQTKIPFVVAINKIDKPEADLDRTKSELSNKLNITPEDWGGKIMCLPISALNGDGIDSLLDSLLLLLEMGKDKIVANAGAPAMGTVIESHVDRGEGPVATILIQNGTLRVGDVLLLGDQPLGKVRVMKDYADRALSEAKPSTPVRIAGLKSAPAVGDIVSVAFGDKKIRLNKVKKNISSKSKSTVMDSDSDSAAKINVIIKSDMLGSAEAIEEALEKLNTKDVKVKIVKKGLGPVTESDVEQAQASSAFIAGFHVTTPHTVQTLARDEGVEIKHYKIIYELVDDIKAKMKEVLGVEIIKVDLGEAVVLAIFKTENKSQIIGAEVDKGVIENKAKIMVLRNGELITDGEIIRLQAGKQDVNSVENGQECGIEFKGAPLIKIGDTLKVYKEEEVQKKF
ncbi:MAG: translation initiation factor IF-2 [bacterium]|nr:translation initiation factor IF-2 [bacterium]